MKGTGQPTLWQFTMESTKQAVKLYFQPVRQVISWLGEDEHDTRKHEEIEARLNNLEQKLSPRFDSLEDLEQRVSRLGLDSATQENVKSQIKEIQQLLRDAHNSAQAPSGSNALNEILAALQHQLRQMEVDLGIEKQLYPPPPTRRTRGASGD